MRRLGVMACAAILAACSPPQPTEPAQTAPPTAEIPAPQAGCNAQASRDWSAVGSAYYVIEAEAHGATCRDAIATIRIVSRDGATLFTRDYPVSQVPLAFNPNGDQTGLRSDLEGWTQNVAETQTADWLPAWPTRAERPPNFQPAVTRGQYEAARGSQGPLFCYPDGGESNACVAMNGDSALYLGSRTPERE
jgi:hypothetical protein